MTSSLRPLLRLAALGVRLRWQLAANRLRRRGDRTRRIVFLAAAAYAAANILVLGSAREASDQVAADTLVLLMASMALGWVFGPVLIGGVDETVDPTRLAPLPLTAIERYVVQLAGALSGIGPLAATLGLLVGLSLGHVQGGLSIVVVPLAALAAILMMVGSARALAAVLAIAQRSRVGRDVAVLLAAIAGGVLFTLAQLARSVLRAGTAAVDGTSPLIAGLGWLPWAWPARAINAARVGDGYASLIWLAASALVAVIAHAAWARLSSVLLLGGEPVAATSRRRGRHLLNGARGPFGAALSRQWIYLRRSPNSRVGFLFGLVFGVAFSLVQIVQQGQGSSGAAAFGILLAMLANLGAATNVLGFDAGSLWLEVLAGGPRRSDLVARQLIALPNLLLPTWLSGVVVAVWTGEWKLVLLVAMIAVPVAVNVLTFGLVTSVIAPAPLPDLDNPFGNRQANDGRGARIAAIAVGGLVTVIALSTPVFIGVFRSIDSRLVWLVPLAGTVYAATIFAAVAGWVGRYLRGREPLLIETLAPRALN